MVGRQSLSYSHVRPVQLIRRHCRCLLWVGHQSLSYSHVRSVQLIRRHCAVYYGGPLSYSHVRSVQLIRRHCAVYYGEPSISLILPCPSSTTYKETLRCLLWWAINLSRYPHVRPVQLIRRHCRCLLCRGPSDLSHTPLSVQYNL